MSTPSSACSTASAGSRSWWTRRPQHGMDSIAITDHGALYGAVAFYQAAKTKGIKPIIGVETYVARRVDDRQGGQGRQPALPPDPARQGPHRLPEPVPARHRRPYRRLLLQAAHRPRAPGPATARAWSGCRPASAARSRRRSRSTTGSWPATSPASTATSSARTASSSSSRTTACPSRRRLNEQLLRLAPEVGLPLVVTNDLHYVRQDQSEAHDVLLCVGTGNNLDTPNRHEVRDARVLREVGGPDGGPLPRPARGDPQQPAHRRDDRPDPAARPAPDPAFPGPGRPHRESWLRAECEAGLARRYGRSRRSSSSGSTTNSA